MIKKLLIIFYIVFILKGCSINNVDKDLQNQWRGLIVENEYRCSKYNANEYHYPQKVEKRIIATMGGKIYSPYTGTYFDKDTETDIEHIVARSEAHDSGLCSATKEEKRKFAIDIVNLTLASPIVNRCSRNGKCGLDAAEWLPEKNKCWFANRVLNVKMKYELSVDRDEANALENILSKCSSTEMIFY